MAGMMGAALLPTLIGGVATMAVSSLLKDDEPPAPAPAAVIPEVEPPTPMPTPNSRESRAAARRSMAQQMARRGRASTILTDDSDSKLGG